MKMKNILTACGIMLTVTVVGISCVKETGNETAKEDKNFSNKTLVQLFNATVNSANTHLFVDNNQVTGTALAYGGLFPSTSYAFQVDLGLRSFSIRSTTAAQIPINFSENMLAAKNYTIFMYDTITAAKQKTVLTNIVIPTDTSARIRFAHFVYAPFAPSSVDIYSLVRAENLVTDLKVTDVTGFIPYPSRVTDTLYIRATGTMNTIFKLPITGSGLTPKRNYTVVYRGSEPRGTYAGSRTASLFANY